MTRRTLAYFLCTVSLLAAPPHAKADERNDALRQIANQRQAWFEHLESQLLTHYPRPGSTLSTRDRVTSNAFRASSAERKTLANKDADDAASYKYAAMATAAFGSLAANNFSTNSAYSFIKSAVKDATTAFDDIEERMRSMDFILKDRIQRARPRDAVNSSGNYINNFQNLGGSSFPSGHSWEGFKEAIVFGLIFPERGAEIHSRGLQYAESRVVLGAHFPTDVIASRIGTYHSLSRLLSDDTIARAIANAAKDIRGTALSDCAATVRACLDALASPLFAQSQQDHFKSATFDPTGNAKPGDVRPDELPEQAEALLRLRFPYLSAFDRRQILAGTAYDRQSLANFLSENQTQDAQWGLINLAAAHQGPSHLYGTITLASPEDETFDVAQSLKADRWLNSISGNGDLILDMPGNLTLAAKNTFSGSVNIRQGTLTIAEDDNLGAKNNAVEITNGTLANSKPMTSARRIGIGGNATIHSDIGNDLSLSGTVAGAGTLIKSGGGTLTLTNAQNALTQIQIAAGTVVGNSASLSGNIQNSGTLLFNQDFDGLYAGSLSGTGRTIKTDVGVLSLPGNSSAYKGTFEMRGGALAIDGTLGGEIHLIAGLLHGNGTVGSIIHGENAIISPGNSFGTLTIDGDYIGQAGLIGIETSLGGDQSPTDRLHILGNAQGDARVLVRNFGGTGAQTLDGIKIIDIDGQSLANFELVGDFEHHDTPMLIAGAYSYALKRNGISTPDDGDWYLRSHLTNPLPPLPELAATTLTSEALPAAITPSIQSTTQPIIQPAAALFEAYPQVLLSLSQSDGFKQRQRERRPIIWAEQGNVDSLLPPDDQIGLWASIRTVKDHIEPRSSFSSISSIRADVTQINVGLQTQLASGDDYQLNGSLGGYYATGEANVRSATSSGLIDYSGGGVLADIDLRGANGFYASLSGSGGWYSADLFSEQLGQISNHNQSNVFSASLEVGHELAVTTNTKVTPQIAILYASANFDDFEQKRFSQTLANISNNSAELSRVKVGFSLEHQTSFSSDTAQPVTANFYIAPSLYHALSQPKTEVDISGTAALMTTERLKSEINFGADISWDNAKYALNIEGGVISSVKSPGEDYQLKGKIGLKMTW